MFFYGTHEWPESFEVICGCSSALLQEETWPSQQRIACIFIYRFIPQTFLYPPTYAPNNIVDTLNKIEKKICGSENWLSRQGKYEIYRNEYQACEIWDF